MSRTIEIAFGWLDKPGPWATVWALLDRYALRRAGEVIQQLEITGIEPECIDSVRVDLGTQIICATPDFKGGEYLAYIAENMGLGKAMKIQFHAPGRELAPGAGIEHHEYVRVEARLNSKAPPDVPMMLEITLEKHHA